MNRVQFMEQLKKLLSDISEEERQEIGRASCRERVSSPV